MQRNNVKHNSSLVYAFKAVHAVKIIVIKIKFIKTSRLCWVSAFRPFPVQCFLWNNVVFYREKKRKTYLGI